MKGWLLVLTLANLALANAIVWFVVAQGWPYRTLCLHREVRHGDAFFPCHPSRLGVGWGPFANLTQYPIRCRMAVSFPLGKFPSMPTWR
jgi:hypothetical protein